MNWTLALNRRILVAFFIGDTHTLERELSPTPPPPPQAFTILVSMSWDVYV